MKKNKVFFFIHLIRLQGLLGYLIGIYGKEGDLVSINKGEPYMTHVIVKLTMIKLIYFSLPVLAFMSVCVVKSD